MATQADSHRRATSTDVVVFHVGDIQCGLDILQVQEIKRIRVYTPVHRSPPFVRGLVNMRGQIITLIDVRQRLGLEPHGVGPAAPAIIVAHRGELMGLLVDVVDDAIEVEPGNFQPPPSNLRGVEGIFFTAVIRTTEGLIALLDKDRISGPEASDRAVAFHDGVR